MNVTQPFFFVLFLLVSSVFTVSAFVQTPRKSMLHRKNLIQRHYFDDVTRLTGSESVVHELKQRQKDISYATEKLAALKELLGYNPVSASKCSTKEVRTLLKTWSRTSGAVGWMKGDELFSKLVGIKVCPHLQVSGCLAFYWKTILDAAAVEGDREGGVYMICFPYCKELYTYDTFTILNSAVDMGRDLCMFLGSAFALTVFHPRYKNAPSLFSPERHAPFPTAGLHYCKKKIIVSQTPDNSLILDEQRMGLERLFNSAAASEPTDVVPVRGDALIPSFYTTNTVVACTQDWFMARIHQRHGAIKHASAVEDRWIESKATMAEEAYADVWAVIHKLEQVSNEKQGVIVSSVFIAPRFSAFNAAQWRQFAVTINAALKRFAKGKITMEIFHPEYVGSQSSNNDLRRSPFPSILISCEH